MKAPSTALLRAFSPFRRVQVPPCLSQSCLAQQQHRADFATSQPRQKRSKGPKTDMRISQSALTFINSSILTSPTSPNPLPPPTPPNPPPTPLGSQPRPPPLDNPPRLATLPIQAAHQTPTRSRTAVQQHVQRLRSLAADRCRWHDGGG